ncbi:MAG TPA: translation initiation factor IF-1 [Candidatus Dojkabacteria bacterium]|nr:translation initiation factor IF-1 [Candidatus Dojkabacteria bacterium]
MIRDPKKTFKIKGKIIDNLPGTKFKVEINLQGEPHVIWGYISGKMRMNYIKIQVGDEVDVEISPYDLTKGRIVYRY